MADKARVQHLIVGPDHAARRLDNFLGSVLGELPKPLIYRIIRTGEVRVNGGRAEPSRKLELGDKVRVPPLRFGATADLPLPREAIAEVRAAILYEDEFVLVLNKPAGLASHAGSGLRYGAIDVLRAARPDCPDLNLTHRLDRDTSGCLLFAKDILSLRRLNGQIADREFQKAYLALLQGQLPAARVVVDTPLESRNGTGAGRRTVAAAGGRAASTTLALVRQFRSCCLVSAKPYTGRTHQIRAHAETLGHPLGGDEIYGDETFNRYLRTLGLRRMFLHAFKLEFTLNHSIAVEAPLPPELTMVVAALENDAASFTHG
ncbi:MAG: RluA family pseudouridine synthase [Gammaproteobacteria bacterium]|nr:RluA family pseudouridine synthase [Gammaproteobacteria bacterium]